MQDNFRIEVKKETPLLINENNTICFGLDRRVLELKKPSVEEQELLLEIKNGTDYKNLLKKSAELEYSTTSLFMLLKKIASVTTITSQKSSTFKNLADHKKLVILGPEKSATLLARMLQLNGYRTVLGAKHRLLSTSKNRSQTLIAVSRYFSDFILNRELLQIDHKVLPVVCSDQSVTVGPVIDSLNKYDSYETLDSRSHEKDFAYFVSQIQHLETATEQFEVMTVVCGLILKQLNQYNINLHDSVFQTPRLPGHNSPLHGISDRGSQMPSLKPYDAQALKLYRISLDSNGIALSNEKFGLIQKSRRHL